MNTINPPSFAEQTILRAGYRPAAAAPIAVINDVAESCCSWCGCTGSLEVRPFWRGQSIRIIARCHNQNCQHEEER